MANQPRAFPAGKQATTGDDVWNCPDMNPQAELDGATGQPTPAMTGAPSTDDGKRTRIGRPRSHLDQRVPIAQIRALLSVLVPARGFLPVSMNKRSTLELLEDVVKGVHEGSGGYDNGRQALHDYAPHHGLTGEWVDEIWNTLVAGKPSNVTIAILFYYARTYCGVDQIAWEREHEKLPVKVSTGLAAASRGLLDGMSVATPRAVCGSPAWRHLRHCDQTVFVEIVWRHQRTGFRNNGNIIMSKNNFAEALDRREVTSKDRRNIIRRLTVAGFIEQMSTGGMPLGPDGKPIKRENGYRLTCFGTVFRGREYTIDPTMDFLKPDAEKAIRADREKLRGAKRAAARASHASQTKKHEGRKQAHGGAKAPGSAANDGGANAPGLMAAGNERSVGAFAPTNKLPSPRKKDRNHPTEPSYPSVLAASPPKTPPEDKDQSAKADDGLQPHARIGNDIQLAAKEGARRHEPVEIPKASETASKLKRSKEDPAPSGGRGTRQSPRASLPRRLFHFLNLKRSLGMCPAKLYRPLIE